MSNYSGMAITNARFRPKLKRKPRKTLNGDYYYCPTFLTKHPDIPKDATLQIVAISKEKDDPSVTVSYGNKEYNVFWEDLRR